MKILGVFKAAKETRQMKAGSVIFEAGATGEEMFGVIEGRIELRFPDGRVISIGPDRPEARVTSECVVGLYAWTVPLSSSE